MPVPIVTVAVPTLAAGGTLADCLRSLGTQTFDRFEVIVIDNSGAGCAQGESGGAEGGDTRVRVIANDRNAGFGAAVNQAYRASEAPYLATLNDDAVAHPGWLEALVAAAEARPRVGMCASEVRLADSGRLDSAGMLIASDASSKQRGHGESPARFTRMSDALFPSGSAALYRREMLQEIGPFAEDFFLYCEDTDLGLRGRWANWECAYVPGAIVEHRYSHSAGRASALKAYYVERNRIYTAIRNFPLQMLAIVPFASIERYFWHLVSLLQGRGKASEFRGDGYGSLLLPWLVVRAHAAALVRLPSLLGERRRIRATARITANEFQKLLTSHSISVRRVAAL